MAEYIDREDLIYKLHNLCKINCEHYPSERDIYCGMCMLNDVLNLIKGCPTADVQPVVHGKWERHSEPSNLPIYFTCENCGAVGLPTFNFCPNCGADVRGKE